MYAEVVFNRPIKPYTYLIPENLKNVSPGKRVFVGLRKSKAVGIVVRIKEKCDFPDIKPIYKVLDNENLLNDDLIEMAHWISQYYLCSLGEAMWSIIPKGFKKREIEVRGYDSYFAKEKKIVLTEEQKRVFDVLYNSIDSKVDKFFLLHGVTGSGKTEIYLRIIDEVVKRGKGAILLVPEISLTPQTVNYFSKRMGKRLAILHSKLTKAEKVNEWFSIISGKKDIVIGARSAIFAPLKNIGAIIVDEEHETSYKSVETPRYNAKKVAWYRAKKKNAILLYGSATPSIESYWLAMVKKFTLLRLPSRVMNQKLPKAHISDLRKLKGQKYLTKPLLGAIERRLKLGEQVILFLNRRGFSPYIYCENCGWVFKCKNCDITLTYHKKEKKLRCHYCGYEIDPPDLCPNCKAPDIKFSGFGTEKIESVLGDYFPGAVIVRMDTDTIKRRMDFSKILSAFSRKEIDILIGTQIVTKGLHFPNVTLVGVLNADISLNFPDFRAAERTFNLITQVSGRAGRSEKGGEVIIQTFNPAHYAIQTAKNQDYDDFFMQEIKYRETLTYPPFCRIIRLVFRGKDSEELFQAAYFTVDFIKERTNDYISILGPSVCPFSKIKSNYRIHVIIKLKKISLFNKILKDLNEVLKKKNKIYIEINIDPVSML